MNFMEEVNQDTQVWLDKLTTKTIMSETTSQSVAILNYLKAGNSLNPMEALNKFGFLNSYFKVWSFHLRISNLM